MIADDLKRWRYTLGLSQPQASAILSTPLATLRQWEQGRREPSAASLAHIAMMDWLRRKSPDLFLDYVSMRINASNRNKV